VGFLWMRGARLSKVGSIVEVDSVLPPYIYPIDRLEMLSIG
jgi:hypothetical protein